MIGSEKRYIVTFELRKAHSHFRMQLKNFPNPNHMLLKFVYKSMVTMFIIFFILAIQFLRESVPFLKTLSHININKIWVTELNVVIYTAHGDGFRQD